jgi:site-specific recombinase XerD
VVRGKGRKERAVFVDNGSKAALEAWLVARGPEAGAIFCPVLKGGRVVVRAMTPQAVFVVLEKRREQAKVRAFSPHDLRRTCVSMLLDSGVDLAVVQGLAGHASPATTARYDRRGEEARRSAARAVHFPFVSA